jgi:hypothetical protein
VTAVRATSVLAMLLLVLPACGATTPSTRPTAEVHFVIEPDTARVYTDGHFVGAARVLAARPESFRTGPRQFTITADGYFPHDLEVDLAEGTTTIEISLRPVPP